MIHGPIISARAWRPVGFILTVRSVVFRICKANLLTSLDREIISIYYGGGLIANTSVNNTLPFWDVDW